MGRKEAAVKGELFNGEGVSAVCFLKEKVCVSWVTHETLIKFFILLSL